MNLREEHGYTYGASSQFRSGARPGRFQIASGVRTDVTAPAVDEIFKEVRGMVDKPVSAEELQKAKRLARQLAAGRVRWARMR